jgi:hypothetical protein
MSVFKSERAATASSRWIGLSSSKGRNADGILPRQSRTTGIILLCNATRFVPCVVICHISTNHHICKTRLQSSKVQYFHITFVNCISKKIACSTEEEDLKERGAVT